MRDIRVPISSTSAETKGRAAEIVLRLTIEQRAELAIRTVLSDPHLASTIWQCFKDLSTREQRTARAECNFVASQQRATMVEPQSKN